MLHKRRRRQIVVESTPFATQKKKAELGKSVCICEMQICVLLADKIKCRWVGGLWHRDLSSWRIGGAISTVDFMARRDGNHWNKIWKRWREKLLKVTRTCAVLYCSHIHTVPDVPNWHSVSMLCHCRQSTYYNLFILGWIALICTILKKYAHKILS